MTLPLKTVLLAALLLPVVAAAQRPPDSQPARRESFSERYGVISERNIFLRDRSRRAFGRGEPNSRPPSFPPPRQAEQMFVLTGVVLEEEEFRAYFENTDSGSILKLRVGDPIARGMISQIEIDAIEYEHAGQLTWIDVGRNLIGVQVSPTTVGGSLTESSSASQPSAPLPNPNDPNLSIEEKMKLRRMQELNKK
ncbi:MAG: hypothetical protein KA354_02035 [Phycisphaerae bacterium]|nr:hypothetical protein [Phycisphaerae bacterium]